jgi:hypothetical protein
VTIQDELKPINVRQSVSDAVKLWKSHQKSVAGLGEEKSVPYPQADSILHSLPRRQQSIPHDDRKL